MSEILDRVGANLRAIRVARGLTQQQFADAVGTSRSYVGAIERGQKGLTLRSFSLLVERVGCSVDDLMKRRDGREPPLP